MKESETRGLGMSTKTKHLFHANMFLVLVGEL